MKKKLINILTLTFACCMIFSSFGTVFAVENADAVKRIKTDLKTLINNGVSPGWAPDVRAHKQIIGDMVDSFSSLIAADKSEFSEKELTDLRAYFTTHFKNEGTDSALLDDMFDLTKEPVANGDSSSAPPTSSQEESKPASSTAASSEVSSPESVAESTIESAVASTAPISSDTPSEVSSNVSLEVSSENPPESEEDKTVGGVVSTQSNPDIGSAQLPKAAPSTDWRTTLLIGVIAFAALGIIIAIWHLFFKKPSADPDSSRSLSADESSWFIDYVKNEDTSSKDAEKKIEEAINALKNSNKNKPE